MNTINVIGNLTKDPETRQIGDDNSITTLRIAVNRPKPKSGAEAKTDYMDVKVWGAQGLTCEKYLAKGKKIAVTGRLEIDVIDRKDGDGKATFVSIVAFPFGVEFLSPKGEDSEREPVAAGSAADLGW